MAIVRVRPLPRLPKRRDRLSAVAGGAVQRCPKHLHPKRSAGTLLALSRNRAVLGSRHPFVGNPRILATTLGQTVPVPDFGSVGLGAFSGAARNAAGGAVGGIIVPAVGAAGGASDAISAGLDLMGQSRQNVFAHCVKELVHRDGSALVAEPGK